MAQTDSLTVKQTALLAALLAGEKVEAAAKSANVSCRTAYRFQKLPTFQEALKEAQGKAFDEKLSILRQGVGAAIATLARNMNEKAPPGVQVRAAAIWLESAIELFKLDGIEAKLDELQSLLRQGGDYGQV